MSPSSPRRLGVFGGTFDPPHLGHLIVARDAADVLALDRVLLVLAARPPHKGEADATAAPLRWEMLEAAIEDDPLLVASDLELHRAGASYTVDTLTELRSLFPETELVLLVGVDQWRQFAGWREPAAIGRLATIAVVAREGEDPGAADPGLGLAYRKVPIRRIDISATNVRTHVRAGRSIRYLVPERVCMIIEREALYRSAAAAALGTEREI